MLTPGVVAGQPAPAHTLQGPFSILRSVITTNGDKGLWLGQTGTSLGESGGPAA